MHPLAAALPLTALLAACAPDREEPDYRVLQAEGDIELRAYPAVVVAQTAMPGDRELARDRSFGVLLEYISGRNAAGQKIAMTAPVLQHFDPRADWTLSFLMPRRWSLEMLPAPSDAAVALRSLGPMKVAAIRFSGAGTEEDFSAHRARLEGYLLGRNIPYIPQAIYAWYDPPWMPGFLRRQEVLLPVAAARPQPRPGGSRLFPER